MVVTHTAEGDGVLFIDIIRPGGKTNPWIFPFSGTNGLSAGKFPAHPEDPGEIPPEKSYFNMLFSPSERKTNIPQSCF